MNVLFWLAVASCAVAQGAIFRALLTTHAPLPGADAVPRPRAAAEVAWALAPALGLALVLGLTWRAIHAPPARVERMRVSGEPTQLRAP